MPKKRFWIVGGMPFHFGMFLGPWVVDDKLKAELQKADKNLRFKLKK